MKTISILGATGSVGWATADVVLSAPDKFCVQTITANNSAHELARLAIKLNAKCAVIGNDAHYAQLKTALSGTGIKACAGEKAIDEAALIPCDLIVCAIAGFAGLSPIMNAISQGTHVAIANKEPLVAAGKIVMRKAQESGARILPLDSEHNAIFQLYDCTQKIKRIVLTASGGPFWKWSADKIANATPQQALAHPTWKMGRKISIDSATMMNKALEVIEAHYLFNLAPEKIQVLVHPQSIVHGMVEYEDGSMLAHMGASDMRTPIAHALAWPQRMKTCGKTLGIKDLTKLEFFSPDDDKFPALALAYDCLSLGEGACVALNAANEIAVKSFLDNQLAFGKIIACIESVLNQTTTSAVNTIEEVKAFDEMAREKARECIKTL